MIMSFVLDANVFIEAARRYYAFDVAPGFWDGLERCARSGNILSIDRVKNELELLKDDLSEWVEKKFSFAFKLTDSQDVIEKYAEIMNWVNNQDQYFDWAKTEFASGADGWLIAYAKVNNCTVVTHEASNLYIRKKVPIPNVCDEFDIRYIDTFEMLRQVNLKLFC